MKCVNISLYVLSIILKNIVSTFMAKGKSTKASLLQAKHHALGRTQFLLMFSILLMGRLTFMSEEAIWDSVFNEAWHLLSKNSQNYQGKVISRLVSNFAK